MPATRPPKKSDLLAIRVPHKTKRAFLKACQDEGRTASDVMRGFVEGYIWRAAARARLRDHLKPRRSIAMIMKSPSARGGGAAAALGALALVVFGVTPSAAEVDLRAAFDALDADADGRVTLEEFSASPEPQLGALILFTAPRVDGAGETPFPEGVDELWFPLPPLPSRASGEGGHYGEASPGGGGAAQIGEEAALVSGILHHQFAGFDRNSDGAVNLAEFEAHHAEMISSTFARFDGDGDGRLGMEEFSQIPVLIAPQEAGVLDADGVAQEGFEALDRDGDQAVTLEEFAAGPH